MAAPEHVLAGHILRLAAEADVCPRTADRYLRGYPVWDKNALRIEAALRLLGWESLSHGVGPGLAKSRG